MSASHETRWLDAQEQQTWRQLSTMILRLQPVLSGQLQREFGISHFEYLIMACLSEAPGSMLRMSVLATITGGSLPRLTQAVGRLEKRTWLTRRPDAADSRWRHRRTVVGGIGRDAVRVALHRRFTVVRRDLVHRCHRAGRGDRCAGGIEGAQALAAVAASPPGTPPGSGGRPSLSPAHAADDAVCCMR